MQNSAFLLKLAHAIKTQPHLFWVSILRSKYRWNEEGDLSKKPKTSSYIWRSLAPLWEDLAIGMLWQIGDGHRVRFWEDNWVGELGPLCNIAFGPISETDRQRPISQFTREDGSWRWEIFSHLLPQSCLQSIAVMKPTNGQDSPAICKWNFSRAPAFSVQSAYHMLCSQKRDDENQVWSLAWKWPGPLRIRTFLWLVLSNRLLTNIERVRRHLTLEDRCELCQQGPEDLNHIFRICPIAKASWQLLLPAPSAQSFFDETFDAWIRRHLKQNQGNTYWCILFGTTCWKLWQARNRRLFGHESIQATRLVNESLAYVEFTRKATRVTQEVFIS